MADATFANLLGSDLLMHYDASDAASLFEDTGGTNACEDGDSVLCWKPQADAALQVNLTQAVGPLYDADYSGGYAGLTFNGTTQFLEKASPGLVTFTRLFCLVAFGFPASGTTRVWSIGTSTTHYCSLRTATAAIGLQNAGGTALLVTATPTSATKLVAVGVMGGGQNQIIDIGACGGDVTASVISGSLADHLYVGNRVGTDQFFNGVLHEIMFIAGTAEMGQVIRAAKLMRTKWGLTDPNPTPQAEAGGATSPASLTSGTLVRN